MKKTMLGIRIQNARIKDVCISRFVWKSSKGFELTSMDDEQTEIYMKDDLTDVIEAYEEDNAFYGYTHFRYWTEEEEIKALFDEMSPF